MSAVVQSFDLQNLLEEEGTSIVEDHADDSQGAIKHQVQLVSKEELAQKRARPNLSELLENDRGLH